MTSLFLALSFLAIPADSLSQDWFRFSEPLRVVYISMEILDPREGRYILARKEEFVGDMRVVQKRWGELYDAPPLAAADSLPARSAINDLLVFNRCYREHLTRCQMFYPGNRQLSETIEETDSLYLLWDAARDAKCDYYYAHIRRRALKQLRQMTRDGELPPCVPVWRFAEVR